MSGGSKEQTVGYRYYMGLHFGVCAGPVDALLEIRAGDRTAWSGSQTANGAISINSPNLFGGEEKEGGIAGTLDVMMGGTTQTANAYLTGVQGATQPAYRGFLGVVFRRGLVACNNPYVKPWGFKIRRALKGWRGDSVWYSAKAAITLPSGDIAMNPAHIVYECLTNSDWGMGYPAAQIDDTNFRAAADAFFTEGLGLCLKWTRQNSIEAFIQIVMDHVGAVMSQDPTTGLFILKLIRGGYTVASLPLYDESNVVAIDSFQRPALIDTTNELNIVFTDVTTGKDSVVTVQNLAQITSQGGVVSSTKQYPGIPTQALATRLALRDLYATSTPLARVRLRLNRQAYALLPGDLIRLTWDKLGISQIVLRILSVSGGTVTNGEITVEAAEDAFGLPSSGYVGQQASGWTDPNTVPAVVSNRKVVEAPYWDLVRSFTPTELSAFAGDEGYLQVIAAKPSSDSQNFQIWTRPNGSGSYTQAAVGDFCPTGALSANITPGATTATLTSLRDPELVATGTYAIIDDEIIRIDSFNSTTGVITFGRGVLDTVAASHLAGAIVYFAQGYVNSDEVERLDNEAIQVKLLSRTGQGILAEASAPADVLTFDQRAFRPYPPGQFRISGQAYPTTLTDVALSASWVTRNRLTQNLQGDETGSITSEAGVTYSLRLYNAANSALLQSLDGQTGTSQTLVALSGTYSLRLELWSVRGGLASTQKHAWTFTYVNISRLTTEGADRLVTEGLDTLTSE